MTSSSPRSRAAPRRESPYNVVHLMLRTSLDAGRLWSDWRERRRRSSTTTSLASVVRRTTSARPRRRTREGLVCSSACVPSPTEPRRPAARAHALAARKRSGWVSRRGSRPCRAALPPLRGLRPRLDPEVELQVDGAPALAPPPATASPTALAQAFALIADGAHRYETALAFHEEAGSAGERVDAGLFAVPD